MKVFVIASVLIVGFLLASCAADGRRAVPPLPPESPAQAESTAPAAAMTTEPGTAAQYHSISPADAKKRLDAGEAVTVLDVRTQEEYDAGHIANSIVLPVDDIAALAASKLPDKSAVIFVYCHSGRRSKIASDQLVGMGYTQVYDLGGILDWPYEVVKE